MRLEDHSLTDLGLSDGMIKHLAKFDVHSPLGFRCQPPTYYRSSPVARRNITALWECGMTLTYFNHDSCKFEQCSLEDIGNLTFSLTAFQAVLADLFIDLYEDDHAEEELLRLAATLGFEHLDRLFSSMNRSLPQDDKTWRDEFLSSCDG